MPTLDWLNRQDAFTTSARVPYRLLEPVSMHGDPATANLLCAKRTGPEKAAQIRQAAR